MIAAPHLLICCRPKGGSLIITTAEEMELRDLAAANVRTSEALWRRAPQPAPDFQT